MKKFTIYGWTTIEADEDRSTIQVTLIPGIEFHIQTHHFNPDNDLPDGLNGKWITLVFSWLIFGITFDLRTGDNAKE